ncbi:hypothetical protein QEN19_000297 [Hanseniaspora menglaensis]
MSTFNKSPIKTTNADSFKASEKIMSTGTTSSIMQSSNVTKSQQTFVPAMSIYGKINNVFTNDPDGYYNKESDKVYELLSSSLEVYMRDIIKKMYENRSNRLKRVTKVVNGKPVTISKINAVIEKINKEDRRLELQRAKSRKENGIVIEEEEGKENEELGEVASSKKDSGNVPALTTSTLGTPTTALSATKSTNTTENNSTANLFSGGMSKKYSWLSGGGSSNNLKQSKSSSNINISGSLTGNLFSGNENGSAQTDIRNHVIKEEKNLVMRDLIKVLEWELQNDNKKFSNKDIQEILAKGYARLRD